MYREDLVDAALATVKGYYAALPQAVGKIVHAGEDEEIPTMEALMTSRDGLKDVMGMVDYIVEARGPMPSDFMLMTAIMLARTVQVQEHLDECENCQEELQETIKRNERMAVIRASLKEMLAEEDDEQD